MGCFFMKQGKLAMLFLIMMLFIIGCSSREYDSNMALGKEQLAANHFLEAYEAFQLAYQDKETEEAKELMELSKLLAMGVDGLEQEKRTEARTFLNEAISYDTKTKEGQQLSAHAEELFAKLETEKATDHNISESKQEVVKDKEQEPLEEEKKNAGHKEGQDSKNREKLSIQAAKKLVQSFINMENYPYLQVQYDHDNEKGHYIFQVFESVEDNEYGHTATWGWYGVDPKTKKVYEVM